MRRARTLLAAILVLVARGALATTAADVPCVSPDPTMPCVLNSSFTVGAGSTLDFGTRSLTIASHGTLDAGGGDMTILAPSLDVQPGGVITSRGANISITTTGDINIEAAASRGRIDVTGNSGGTVTLLAGGNLTVAGQILGPATATSGDGGSIDVTGTNVTISGRLGVTGGTTGFGGDISVSAVIGGITMTGTGVLDASGGDGGTLSVDADGDITIADGALLDGNAGAAGSGDSIDITSYGGNVSIGAATVRAHGPGDLVNGGGSGADFCIDAAATITNNAAVDMSGGGQDALGGTVEVTTDGDIIQRGTIDVSAEGNGGFAGLIAYTTSVGMVDIAGGAFTADGPGAGGDVSAFSYNGVSVANRITADGPSASIELQGCAINVTAAARLSSVGPAGSNVIQASGQMTVAGMLSADPNLFCSNDATIACVNDTPCHVCVNNHLQQCAGPTDCGGGLCDTTATCSSGNVLQYRDPAMPPVITGSVIVPAAVQLLTPTLVPCGGPPTTTSTTMMTTTTTTTTLGTVPTTTATSTTATTNTVITTSTTTVTVPATTTSTTIAATTTTTSTTASTTTSTTVSTTTSTTASTTTSTTRAPATTTTATTSTTTTTLAQPQVCDPPDCQDGNSCTDDSCGADGICVHEERMGLDAVSCRLEGIVDVLSTAPVADVGGPGTRGRFQAAVTKVQHMFDAARSLSGKRQVVKFRRANKLLTGFIHTVEKGEHRGKVKGDVGKQITDLAGGAQTSLKPFIL